MSMSNPDGGILSWAAVLAIVFSVGEIVASVYLKRATLLGFGAVGIVMFSLILVMETFGGSIGAPMLMLIVGVVFIIVAVVVGVLAPRIRRTPKQPKVPNAPKMPGAPLVHA
jgi:hypothetical protein